MINNSFVKKILRIISSWFLIGILVVSLRRIIEYGFTREIFINKFKEDFIIGLGTAIVVGLLLNLKKLRD